MQISMKKTNALLKPDLEQKILRNLSGFNVECFDRKEQFWTFSLDFLS